MKAGSKLIIPIAPGRHDAQTVAYSRHPSHYKVRKGDTVASVADDFEVPVEKLRKWNHLRGSSPDPGTDSGHLQAVSRRAPRRSPPTEEHSGARPRSAATSKQARRAPQAAKYHKVKKGETLSSIAESNHTSVAALKRDNPKLTANLRAGEVLLIRK